MSIESARSFMTKLNTDLIFRNKFASAKNDSERDKFAQEEGFDFTASEIREAIDELTRAAGGGHTCQCGHGHGHGNGHGHDHGHGHTHH
ncbi:MAG: Nif11-like leader peptide family natural product precursor [Nitrospirae bacterium]|nr:Nif11-like leader peptide family natural product precursor [Nitrospirota bacterium]